MYEKPTLNKVGAAEDVILGSVPFGNDIDMNYVEPDLQWEDEED